MNETSATSASGESLLPDGITTLTTIHFAIIAVLALFVIAGLLWGIKAKRSRVKASRDRMLGLCMRRTEIYLPDLPGWKNPQPRDGRVV